VVVVVLVDDILGGELDAHAEFMNEVIVDFLFSFKVERF